jgi:ribonuclease HI
MTYAELIAAVQALTPEQRRTLYRHLRAAGLLDNDSLASDQGRLQVAPALGKKRLTQLRTAGAGQLRRNGIRAPVTARPASADAAQTSLTEPAKPSLVPAAPEATRGSPVSGRVVLGTPTPDAAAPTDPHAMSPLPGHAPARPIEIIFDGGSKGNPGFGYGSYALRWPGRTEQIVQLKFGNRVTNNEAEYDTLIAALEATLKRLREDGADPKTAQLIVRGDSLLVLNQIRGEWKCKEQRLRTRRDHARQLLTDFGESHLIHHKRAKSVAVLGH